MTELTWAAVTALSPLRIKLDGDSTALPFTPESLVDPRVLTVADRVRVELTANRVIVVGISGGVNEIADMGLRLASAYLPVQTLYVTASTTFSKATYPWLRGMRVRVQAAGGGGGGAAATAANYSVGGGGGGGGYAEKVITDIAGLASSVAVTVGAGGTAGAGSAGGTGGSSSFGTAVVATGGTGGGVKPANVFAPYINGGAGGIGTAGDVLETGNGGTAGAGYSDLGSGGAGGASRTGGGARSLGQGSGGVAGEVGGIYGGGGGGAYNSTSQSARAGGVGGAGIVILELFA